MPTVAVSPDDVAGLLTPTPSTRLLIVIPAAPTTANPCRPGLSMTYQAERRAEGGQWRLGGVVRVVDWERQWRGWTWSDLPQDRMESL